MSTRRSKTFEADLGRLEEALAFIEPLISGPLGSGERANDLLLASEEAFANVAKHAYPARGEIEVIVETGKGSASVSLRDRGRPFDPLSVPSPALDEAPEDRAVGGLGIHLMRNLVDELRYRREGEWNVLTLTVSTSDRDISTGFEPAR